MSSYFREISREVVGLKLEERTNDPRKISVERNYRLVDLVLEELMGDCCQGARNEKEAYEMLMSRLSKVRGYLSNLRDSRSRINLEDVARLAIRAESIAKAVDLIRLQYNFD